LIAEAAKKSELEWLISPLGLAASDRAKGIKAVDANGTIKGMVVYDDFTFGSCRAHMRAETPIAWRALLPHVFEYPFHQLGLSVLLAVIPADNEKSLRLTESLGFRCFHEVPNGYAIGTSLYLFEMKRADCRWLAKETPCQ
jgi:hypothetical protein